MLDSIGIGYFPDQSLTDSEIIAKYGSLRTFYLETGRYWARSYNKLPTPSTNKTIVGVGGGEVQQIVENFRFYHGIQQNAEFTYLNESLNENGQVEEMATPYLAGQDLGVIINFMQGQFLGIVQSAEPRVDVINPDIKNAITKKLKMVEVARKYKPFIEKITQATGIEFVPPASPQAKTEEVVKTISRSFTSDLLLDAGRGLEYIRKNYMGPSDYVRSLTNQSVGRRAAIYINDDAQLEEVAPHRYFSVAARDDDFGRFDVARGMVNYIHKDAAIAKYHKDLTPNEINSLKTMSFYGTDIFNSLQNLYNYTLFDQRTQFLSEVVIFWESTIDSGYGVTTTEEDGKKIYKVKKTKSDAKSAPVKVIKTCTLLANTFAVGCGIYDIIDDPEKFGNRLFPIVVSQPNTYLGVNQCIVDRLKPKQKELDAINQRVRENYTMDLGTLIAINGKKFRDGITAPELFSQARRTRFIMATETGEDDDPANSQPIMQREDVSLMKEIQNYFIIKDSLKAEIKEIANVSAIIMGTQTEYTGLKTQQNSAALASNSLLYGFGCILQLHADAAAIALEKLKKLVQRNPDRPKWQNLFGEDGVARIVALKDDPYTGFTLTISTHDIIDPVRKQRMLSMLDNLMATKQIDFADWLDVEDAKTMPELKEAARISVTKKAEFERVSQLISQAGEQQKTDTIAEAQVQGKQVESNAMLASKNATNVTTMAKAMIMKGAPQEEVAEFVRGAAEGGAPQQQPVPQ